MAYQYLLFEAEEGRARITVNRPDKLNALSNAVMAELDDAFARVEESPGIRGLVLTGAGEKAFVAGADISELVDASPLEGKQRCLRDQRIMRRLETMGKPSIAAINGYALGGGLELAMCCTLRVCALEAKLGLPEAKIGVFPANGGTQRLPQLIGRGRALEMMLTGKLIDAPAAERWGLVNRAVPRAELLPFCDALLHEITANAPLSAAAIMDCVDASYRCGLDEGLQFEAATFAGICSSRDRREGTLAFLEKRRPEFQGR